MRLSEVMRPLVIQSFAKLNLTFEILGTLPGGFHQVRTIFHNIDLADTLSFQLLETNADASFQVVLSLASAGCDTPSEQAVFPLDDTNLIVRAAKKFALLNNCGQGKTLKVAIEKKIPIAAGLAGGSSNAAAALKAMSVLFQVDTELTGAREVAAQLGSDINFCLDGGTKIGSNRGELLTPVEVAQPLTFLLLKPRQIAISTPWIYREYDAHLAAASSAEQLRENNHTEACLRALSVKNTEALAGSFFNAFEPVCFEHFPHVLQLKDAMLKAGCLSANITGSGPTLFGLLSNRQHGLEVKSRLLSDLSAQPSFDIWIVESSGAGVREAHENATF